MCQLPVRTGNENWHKPSLEMTLLRRKVLSPVSTDKGVKIREVPFAYHPNFIAKVADIVNQHERQVEPFNRTIVTHTYLGLQVD